MPVARAAFFATRLSPAPVFRTALFADLIAFVVLDFLRLAFFMILPVPKVRSAWLFSRFVPYDIAGNVTDIQQASRAEVPETPLPPFTMHKKEPPSRDRGR
jgi:hypothetical protein